MGRNPERLAAIERLKNMEVVQFKCHGNSMTPMIYSGQKLTVEPIRRYADLKVGDAVFCKVKGNIFVHKIYAIKQTGARKPDEPVHYEFQIGNNHGHINGWTGQQHVYGKFVRAE